MKTKEIDDITLGNLVERLSELSERDRGNPERAFDWPESLPPGMWMSRKLLTVHGTDAELEPDALARLSRWESIHFYSLNVHGIRELLAEVVSRIHTPGYELVSPFFHHFIEEENEHMQYFAEFCTRYGGKLYPNVVMKTPNTFTGRVADLLVFAKIQTFEETVDYFNTTMANDPDLHPFIRKINSMHHRDESRHIAFGRQIVGFLFDQVRQNADEATLAGIDAYLRSYLAFSVQSLYNPQVYRDAELPGSPFDWRRRLLGDPGRRPVHDTILRRPLKFLREHELVRGPVDVA
jgi:hypothetical protein